MAYKSKYTPKNKEKYKGDLDGIVCRSLWERWLCKKFDSSDSIEWWSSEELIIKYYDTVTNKWRRYFPDFIIKFKQSGKIVIIEVKPEYQTHPPVTPKKKNKHYLHECMTYQTNQCKWKYAEEFAKNQNIEFQIWTEVTLRKLGAKGI